MKVIKYIFKKIPKFIKWILIVIIIVPILGYIVLQFAIGNPIIFSHQNLFYIIVLSLLVILVGFIVGSIRSIKFLLDYHNIETKNNLIELPFDYVSIGTYTTEFYCADIRARIVLNESTYPKVDIFLDRIPLISPYCPKCQRPLEEIRTVLGVDQIGYRCKSCDFDFKTTEFNILDDIKGEVRRNYTKYLAKYKNEIIALTKGEPKKYKLRY
jgi:hypothetical protein